MKSSHHPIIDEPCPFQIVRGFQNQMSSRKKLSSLRATGSNLPKFQSHRVATSISPRSGKERLQAVLDEATKARAKSIELKGTQFADQLSDELLKHGIKMETLYGKLKVAVNDANPCDATVKSILDTVAAAQAWYEKAEVWFKIGCVDYP